jgi:hypothetical protein
MMGWMWECRWEWDGQMPDARCQGCQGCQMRGMSDARVRDVWAVSEIPRSKRGPGFRRRRTQTQTPDSEKLKRLKRLKRGSLDTVILVIRTTPGLCWTQTRTVRIYLKEFRCSVFFLSHILVEPENAKIFVAPPRWENQHRKHLPTQEKSENNLVQVVGFRVFINKPRRPS